MNPDYYVNYNKAVKALDDYFNNDVLDFSVTTQKPYSSVHCHTDIPNYVTDYTITTTGKDWNIFDLSEKENTMSLFNWFLVEKWVEGKEPTKTGFITASSEESAREFIIRTFDKELFDRYKDEEFALVVCEVDSWEV